MGTPARWKSIFSRKRFICPVVMRLRRSLATWWVTSSTFFISASPGNNLKKVLEVTRRVARERRKRITTGQMNRFLEKIDFQRAGVPLAQKIRIYYMTQ